MQYDFNSFKIHLNANHVQQKTLRLHTLLRFFYDQLYTKRIFFFTLIHTEKEETKLKN